MARVIKYILNLASLIWMGWAAYVSYALIVRFPPCNYVTTDIWSNVAELVALYVGYILVAFVVNWFIQRKFERMPKSREHLAFATIQIIVLAAATYYFSYDFYSHCGLKA